MSDNDNNVVDGFTAEGINDAVPKHDNDDIKSCEEDDKMTRRMRTARRNRQVANQDQSFIWTIADVVISSVTITLNTLLGFIGLGRIESERERRVRALSKSFSKRKRCDKLKSETQDGKGYEDDVGDEYDENLDGSSDEDDNVMELEMKRWRPDGVFMAVERFISRMWGEKDSNENIKENDNDENMNSFASTPENATGDGNWSKKPNINFVSDSFISDINDMSNVQDKGIHGTSTPCIVVNDNTSADETAGSKVFVFSAEKSGQEAEDNDDASMSTLTFEEKQAYFTEQIKVQSAEALKGISKTPDKLTAAARTVN